MKKLSKGLRITILVACVAHFSSIFVSNFYAYQSFHSIKKDLPAHSVKILNAIDKVSAIVPSSMMKAIDTYNVYTGITGYSFFSPDPPFPYQIIVERTESNGGQSVNGLTMETTEGYSRLISVGGFIRDIKNDSLKDLMMRSLAARTYEKYPETQKLRIQTAYYILPPPKLFSQGNKPIFAPHKVYEFNKF
jgi:hypothetical protein